MPLLPSPLKATIIRFSGNLGEIWVKKDFFPKMTPRKCKFIEMYTIQTWTQAFKYQVLLDITVWFFTSKVSSFPVIFL